MLQESVLRPAYDVRAREDRLRTRTGPRLADGTYLAELIDLDRREVAMRVLSDPEIFTLEMQRIFSRSWIGIAHESEVAEPGDFVLRRLGLDSVVVVRGKDRVVRVLLNACSHRGMEVCWGDQGNTSTFKCPYHGWTFNTSGDLIGAPHERQVYGDDWDKSSLSLVQAAVVVRYGIVYANLDSSPVPFDEYVGDLGWYLEQSFGDTEWEVVGGDPGYLIHNNWKVLADQNAGDAYHSVTLHRSLEALGLRDNLLGTVDHMQVSVPSAGHAVFAFNKGLNKRRQEFAAGRPGAAELVDVSGAGYSTEKVGRFVSVMFPSTQLMGHDRILMPDGSLFTPAGMGGFVPVAPDRFIQEYRILVPKGTSDEYKRTLRRERLVTTGFTVVDDCEQGPSMQRVSVGAVGRRQPMRYFNVRGPSPAPDWEGPGVLYGGSSVDDGHWDFWLRWFELLSEEPQR